MNVKNLYRWDSLSKRIRFLLAMSAYYCDLTEQECRDLEALAAGVISSGSLVKKNALIKVLYTFAMSMNWNIESVAAPIVRDTAPITTQEGKTAYNKYFKYYREHCQHSLTKHKSKHAKG